MTTYPRDFPNPENFVGCDTLKWGCGCTPWIRCGEHYNAGTRHTNKNPPGGMQPEQTICRNCKAGNWETAVAKRGLCSTHMNSLGPGVCPVFSAVHDTLKKFPTEIIREIWKLSQ